MVCFPELGLKYVIPTNYDGVGFRPYVADQLLTYIVQARSRVSKQSHWLNVPTQTLKAHADHMDIVLSDDNPMNIMRYKMAEYGSLDRAPEAIVRQSIGLVSNQIEDLHNFYKGADK